mmetsp:Transcript_67009/g.178462  ORF Transcript_67009/g.178462 Transcript_67009/m.178462 type:complete len:276 (+) Transcript_67009:287-1114(+)
MRMVVGMAARSRRRCERPPSACAGALCSVHPGPRHHPHPQHPSNSREPRSQLADCNEAPVVNSAFARRAREPRTATSPPRSSLCQPRGLCRADHKVLLVLQLEGLVLVVHLQPPIAAELRQTLQGVRLRILPAADLRIGVATRELAQALGVEEGSTDRDGHNQLVTTLSLDVKAAVLHHDLMSLAQAAAPEGPPQVFLDEVLLLLQDLLQAARALLAWDRLRPHVHEVVLLELGLLAQLLHEVAHRACHGHGEELVILREVHDHHGVRVAAHLQV